MATITLEYDPRPQFLPFHNRKRRDAVLVCHRRMGKTVAVVADLIIGALECQKLRPQFAYIAPNYQQAKRIAWEYLKQYAAPFLEKVSESELKVVLKNGATIWLLGAERADSLRGLYLDGAALDEFAQMRPSTLSQIILPALSDRQGWLVIMGTPKGKNHFYDEYKRSLALPEQYFTLMVKASQSGILPAHELDRLRSAMDESDYLQEMECSFEASLKGAIYGMEMERIDAEKRIGDFPLDPNLPTDVIFDLGFTDDTVATFFQVNPGGILIHEIHSDREQDWDHYMDLLDSREIRNLWLPHDARAKNLQTGLSIVEQTIKRGYRPQIVPDHKLRDGIVAVRKLLPFTYWNFPLTSGGYEAMKGYRREWDDKHMTYKENPLHDWTSHVADCIRYLAVINRHIHPVMATKLPERKQNGSHYSFTLDDLFTDPRVNPGMYREH